MGKQQVAQSETTSAREACKGCGGTGVTGASRITCSYCFGSGKAMYVVDSKSDAVTFVGRNRKAAHDDDNSTT